jgi:hypothetical protein
VFAGFDVVEELLVADGVRQVRKWLRDPQRLGRAGAGRGGRPGRDPGVGHSAAPAGGQEVDRAQPVEHGVAPVGVGEVEDYRRAVGPTPVAGMKVAVHDGVGQAAVRQHLPPRLEASRGARFRRAQLRPDRAVEQIADGCRQAVRAAVGDAERERADAGLRGRQAAHVARRDLVGDVPAVRAGNVGQQQAARPAGQDGRHQARVDLGERADRGRLGGGEAGDGLEPDRAVGCRQAEQRRQVPGLALDGPPGEVDLPGCPFEEFPHARRARPGQPEWVIFVGEVARGELPRWLECFRMVGDLAVARPVGTLDREQPQDDNRHAQGLLQLRDDRLDLGPPRDLDWERADAASARPAVRHDRGHHASHPASLTARQENPHRISDRAEPVNRVGALLSCGGRSGESQGPFDIRNLKSLISPCSASRSVRGRWRRARGRG